MKSSSQQVAVLTVVLFLCYNSVSSASVPEKDYKGAWMREHWSIDSFEPLNNGEEYRQGRQFGGFGDLGKVVDSVGKFDLKEVSKFLKEIPELFESVNTLVEGAETSFGEGASDS